ncbi:transcriptional regulator, LysR family [Shewanella amazonensis SB2B]|uniref:Transcriptional regulator, LysR family n=1 Tax=Shewanella amazonensis (strain ATCC BAA-1098 / SB2B) TaxID=326297 RepID=A1S3E5_SHEAM|nr:LysR family transcriptional regulator [Shewanella amazonensis]ABL98901.1 transcriptional regulator, LysR family [Shewanella amazonensis SB2B]
MDNPRLKQLSIRLLQVFITVVRLGNVSAAARQLHLTQPTVSLQLKKIAELVGEPLLESRDGVMRPTDVGEEVYRAACDILSRLDDLDDFLGGIKQGESGHIRIGLVTTAKYVMPRILGPFYRRFPKVQVTLSIGNRAHVLNRFAHQEDDLYLFSHPPAGESVLASRIITNPLKLIAPADHWAVGQKGLGFDVLKGERFIMREPGSATRMMFESWLSARGIELTDIMQIESNEAIRLSVASGLGLSVISAHTLSEGDMGPEKPAVLDVADFPLRSNWYLVARRDKRLPQSALQLIRFMAEHLGDCIDPGYVADNIEALHRVFTPSR